MRVCTTSSSVFIHIVADAPANAPPQTDDERLVEKRFDGAGWDRELIETIERDILMQHPKVGW